MSESAFTQKKLLPIESANVFVIKGKQDNFYGTSAEHR